MSALWLSQQALTSPEERFLGVGIVYDGHFYILGGWLRVFTCSSYLWRFNIATQQWFKLPIPRIPLAVSFSLVQHLSMLVMFGGQYQFANGSIYLLDTTTVMDPATMTTYPLRAPPSSPVPMARMLHTAVVFSGEM